MKNSQLWKLLFGLWSTQGFAVLLWLFLIPTDAGSPLILGFTSARLLLIGVAGSLAGVSALLIFYERLPLRIWFDVDRYAMLWDIFYIFALIVQIASPTLILLLYSLPGDSRYIAYAERLAPLAMWFWLSSFELILSIVFLRRERGIKLLSKFKPIFRTVIVVFVILLIVILSVASTGIGITPDENMGAPAIPLFEWQVVLILLTLVVFALLPLRDLARIDRWIAPCIYVFTIVLWLSQPINTAYTATPPRAPNFEIYPFSDPQIYSQYAQAALVGNGFLYPDVPSRSLYIAFLTWAYLLGKQTYNLVVVIQSLILAFLPVLLYLIGRELSGHALGFGLAAMSALRDVNSNIAVPFASNVTYSKLLLSEIPLAVFLALFILLITRWLKRDQRSIWLPLLAGGVLGGATLIRTQSMALIAIVVLVAFFVIPDRKQWLNGVTALGIALAITLLPWLARNYIATGGLLLDNPVSQVMTMARRWNGSWGNETFPRLEGETDAQYSGRMTRLAIDAFKRDPQFILQTAANHFINSEIASLMILPIRDEIRSPSELLFPQHAFWSTTLTPHQLPLFAVYLVLLGLGVTIAVHRFGWLGILPLGLGLSYNVWSALFFSSGERFIVPLDWTVYFYQFLGMIAVGMLLLSFTQGGYEHASSWVQHLSEPHQIIHSSSTNSRRNLILTLCAIVLLAAFTPLTESVFPQKYPPLTIEEFEQLTGIPVRDGETFIYGRATYPRYYSYGEGEPETEKIGYRASEEARLVFYFVGSANVLVVFELQNAPEFFPHSSDVYLVGEWSDEGYFSPRVALVSKDGQTKLYQVP